MSGTSGIKFRPVMGPEELIKNTIQSNGYFYIATDSGNMYLDVDNHRISVGGAGGAGGSTGFSWAQGNDSTIVKASDDDSDNTYNISFSALEDSVLPKVGNLILNSDGRFFRVLSIDSDQEVIVAELIAVSGSGGSGGGGGQAVERDVDITWDTRTISTGNTYIYGQTYNAVFTPTTTAVGDTECRVTFNILDRANNTTTSLTQSGKSGAKMNFNMGQLPLSTNITLQIIVTSDNSQYNNGLGYQRNITGLKVVSMSLEKPTDEYLPLVKADDMSGTLTLKYMPIGQKDSDGNALVDFFLHTYVDDIEVPSLKQGVPASAYGRVPTIAIPRQSHGVHKISFKLSTNINGTDLYSNEIYYEGAWADANDDTPIIWIGKYDNLVVNYENSYIYYMVYDPINYTNGLPAEIHLYKENVEVSQINAKYSDDGWLIWDISNLYEVGANNFSISCRTVKIDIPIEVTTVGSRDLEIKPKDSLLVDITTAGRSSTEISSQRNILKSNTNTNVTCTLSNFNWQNNGWRDSEGVDANGVDSGSYLSIANGSAMSIRMAGSGLALNQSKDYTFEMRFRVRNVQEYSTLIRVVPKFFYCTPVYDENDPSVIVDWHPTYTRTVNGDEVTYSGPSLFEEEIIERGYKIGVDEEYGNILMDEENTIKREDTSSGVVVRWLNDAGYGFCIGTQEAFFKTPSGIANVRYCEDEVINISMVASKTDSLCYIYLNGILSGVTPMPTGAGSSFSINSAFSFNSEYCDFDLYRFRVFEVGLSMPQVIHNYLADMHSIKLYDQNQITDPLDPTALSYPLLIQYNENHPESLSMPYATWQIMDGDNENLPYKKGNNRVAAIDFVNPTADQELQRWIDGEVDSKGNRLGYTPFYYYTHSPSFSTTKADINVQGTSSQKYPRRNYKTKLKDKKTPEVWTYTKGPLAGLPVIADYYFSKSTGEYLPNVDKNSYDSATMNYLCSNWHMDAEDWGVNKFTWKIDYMESSETYNTGFANLMGNLSHRLYSKHPLDDYNLGIDTDNYRMTVYGFPVLTFHKYADGQYEYVGKYNMNLDKGADEAYGYVLKNKQPYVPQRTKKVLNTETNTYEDTTYQPTIKEIAECWELKDNQGTWCSWKFPGAESREAKFGTLQEGTSGENAKLEILKHFEYRYSYYADQLDEAYDYNTFTDPDTQIEYANNGQINSYLREKHANLEKLFVWLDSTDTNNVDVNNPVQLASPVTYEVASVVNNDPTITYTPISEGLWNATFTHDTKEYRRQKFKNELAEHLDKEYCLTYFVLTELLLCYDSRGKNLMMATFGPTHSGGEYIWYPIFYDIDTQLGLNNSGAYLWDYDADVTKNNLFSTPTSVLWVNLYDVFYDDIVRKYRVLRGISNATGADDIINGSLTEENIVGAYECNPAVFDSPAMKGVRPIVAVGLDEYYKYLAPALTAADYTAGKLYAGYYDTSGAHMYQATPTYAYCAQGDKKLTTELLIRNRLNYIDSWWLGGDYRAGVVENQIFIRANANHSSTSDLFLDSASLNEIPSTAEGKGFSLQAYPKDHFDARPGAKIKPFLHQYVSYFMDSQPSIPIKYDGGTGQEDGVWTNVDAAKLLAFKTEPDLSQQITYIPGGDYISSLGDISLMYPNSLQIFHGQRLLDLNIGSDTYGYKNPLLTSSSDWELTSMPLLKSVNISNLNQFNREMNLTASKKLQEFRALGSIIERVGLASGAPLDTVHLPATMTTVSFIQNKNLKNILTSKPVDPITNDYVHTTGLYIEGVTDYDSSKAGTGHKIVTYEVEGGGLGYNSYTILKNLYDLKYGASTNQYLRVSLVDVEWTPYQLVEVGTAYSNEQTYYFLNDHSTFEPFTFVSANDWNDKLLNEQIYIYNPEYTKFDANDPTTANAEERTITNLDLLDNFIAAYELAEAAQTESQFANTSGSVNATVPTITGTMYVSNSDGAAINEALLTSKYKEKFPNLTIHVANVNPANISKYVRVYDSGKVEVLAMERTDGNTPLAPSTSAPSQTYYDFRGWSLQNPREVSNPSIVLQYNEATASYSTTAEWLALNFDNTNVLTFYAVFIPHEYQMTFKYTDGTIIDTVGTAYNPSQPGINVPAALPYMDESELPLNKKYAFLGYAYTPDTVEPLNMSNITASKDMTFYAIFDQVDVHENPLDDRYLVFIGPSNYEDRNHNQVQGFEIALNTSYAIRGKITLPTTHTVNGTEYPVCCIQASQTSSTLNGFSHNNDGKNYITHIFWDDPENAKVFRVETNAFRSTTRLKYFEMPPSLYYLGGNCFYESACEAYAQLQYVRDISQGAFTLNTGEESTVQIYSTTETIGSGAFSYMTNLRNFILGTSTAPTRVTGLTNQQIIWPASADPIQVTIYTDDPTNAQWSNPSTFASQPVSIVAV